MSVRPPTPKGLKPKDLIGVPWLLAFALQREGWYLRVDIVWNKSNCQAESVKGRPTRSHEYFFCSARASTTGTIPPPCADPMAATSEPFCRPDDLILDPFIGSGTTGVVALKLNRSFVDIELNPVYLKIAESRLRGELIQ